MNVRELIDQLLKHDVTPSTEVMIEGANGISVATYRVSFGKTKRGWSALLIEPDEEMTTMADAEERFLVQERDA